MACHKSFSDDSRGLIDSTRNFSLVKASGAPLALGEMLMMMMMPMMVVESP